MGTDVNASASTSSSATSGLRSDNTYRYGDVIISPNGKPSPPWLWVGLAGLALVGLVVFLVRR